MEGQRIGNYRVARKIGQGGMGAVYEAVHEQLGRKVALKLLRRELSQDPQIATRFFNEAKAASRVYHSGIVQIYEFGNFPDGTAFIAMELLRGEALSARLRAQGGKLQLPETVRISRQIASALAATHQIGIVHRDLKPDNIMLVPDSEMPGGERVKVLDFGIAKFVADYSGPGAEDFKTNTGMVLGTATYMAPEQCKGAGNVDEKADVYSLGVVMYRMLSGQLPFRAEGQGEIMAMHIFSTAKPVREHDPNIPEPLAALVEKMMSKDPAERPAMAQLATELEKFSSLPAVQGQPVFVMVSGSGDPSSSGSTLSAALGQSGAAQAISVPQPPRSRWPLWLGALGLVAVAAGLGARLVLRQPWSTLTATHAAQQQTPGPAQVVQWTLSSVPDHAEVLRKSDGQPLGFTPWTRQQPQGRGQLVVVLRAAGHQDREVVFEEHLTMSRHEIMVPVAPLPPLPTENPGAGTASPSPGPANPNGSAGTPPENPAAKANPTPGAGPAGTGTKPLGTPTGPTVNPLPGQKPGLGPKRKPKGDGNANILTDDNVEIIQ